MLVLQTDVSVSEPSPRVHGDGRGVVRHIVVESKTTGFFETKHQSLGANATSANTESFIVGRNLELEIAVSDVDVGLGVDVVVSTPAGRRIELDGNHV